MTSRLPRMAARMAWPYSGRWFWWGGWRRRGSDERSAALQCRVARARLGSALRSSPFHDLQEGSRPQLFERQTAEPLDLIFLHRSAIHGAQEVLQQSLT